MRSSLSRRSSITFCNYNRVTEENRKGMWEILKKELQLLQDVPNDFSGLPRGNMQNAWLFPWAKDRPQEHMSIMWDFFIHILDTKLEDLNEDLMDQCLQLQQIGKSNLTMGMFWARPKTFLSLDSRNLAKASSLGITVKPNNAATYKAWALAIKESSSQHRFLGDLCESFDNTPSFSGH